MSEIKNPISIFGLTSSRDNISKTELEDNFDVLDDNSEMITSYISKETYETEEDGDLKPFKYKYVIEVYEPEYNDEDDGHDGNLYVTLYMVIDPKDVHPSIYQKVTNYSDVEEADYYDFQSEGFNVIFEQSEFKNGEYDLKEILNAAANAVDTINAMRGFWLDRYKNRLGNTGWDYIEWLINNKDLFSSAKERWEEEKEENN